MLTSLNKNIMSENNSNSGLSAGTILYLQWETYLSKQKLELSAKQFNALSKERNELRLGFRQ